MTPAMDFFGQQDAARRSTRRLVLLFAIAVVATVLAIYLAVVVAFHDEMRNAAYEQGRFFWPWNAAVLGWVSGLTGAVIAGGSLYKTAALAKGGGESVASLLGGKPLEPGNASPAERRLLNVVEEMALAAGTAVPSVYVLPDEQGINAFAAGLSPNAAVIGVTRGAVERLDRDELQGVIAHELSHVLNGDMRLNLRLIGLLHGILVISLIGLWILRFSGGSSSSSSSREKKGGGGGAALFGLAIYVIGWIGGFFGGIIKSAISRQREFLADAAAVQFTRNPLGIAGALKKIGGLSTGSKLQSPNAPQASHLFFGNGLPESQFAWRSTHPPLAERIRRLDPAWDGTYPKLAGDEAPAKKAKRATAPGGSRGADRLTDLVTAGTISPRSAEMAGMVLAGIVEAMPQTASELAPLAAALSPEQIAASAGQPRPAHVTAAAGLIAALPEALAARAREPMTARAVVLALLCDRDAAVRARQLERVAASGDEALSRELAAALPAADALPGEARLPLVDLAVPALRKLSRPQYAAFRALVDELVRADERLSLFEWALHRVLLRHLEPWFVPKKAPRVTAYALDQLDAPLSLLLSTLAQAGSDDPAAVQAAFAAGVAALGRPESGQAPRHLTLCARDECTFGHLDAALDTLATVTPARLRELLTACAATVASDGVVSGAEGELLRAVADALGCPVPPLLTQP
ncbi:MAG TPA: M48 family metallopeptidase [Thermoanaerobaculia bacterium]|nr:M48 family metallopeptidase [Thermoanaerobaculia bacterium]